MFTENLKFHRINGGLSQEKLAELADVSLRTIQRLENGDTEPRGDTVIRLAQALDISPADLLQYKKKEDRSYLKALNMSAFSFLLFPLMGVILPFILWITKRDQIQGVDHLGKQIINFQITWNLVLFTGLLCYQLWYRLSISTINEISISISQNYMMVFYGIIGVIYLYNILISLYNMIRVWQNQSTWFNPAFRLMK
ncbi:MAG TPA: DNA-binding protein [Bacteroidetes bacterium]|nr:DNA-binding protein [Bacteroidota bacterium]